MDETPTGRVEGVRKLILERAHDARVTLAELSRRAGKNGAYMHQYVMKGTPRRLDEETRRVVAQALGLDENALREPGNSPSSERIERVQDTMVRPGQIPYFREGDVFDAAVARSWGSTVETVAGPVDFCIWIDVPRGRLNAGDLVLCQSSRPARLGDLVAVVRDKRLDEIGELKQRTSDQLTLLIGQSERTLSEISAGGVFRIVGVLFP